MSLIERGKVQGGGIVFSEPLALPEGTEVIVHIEPVTAGQAATPNSGDDFSALPFFGMWADREDMADSIEWVRRNREQWQQRVARQD